MIRFAVAFLALCLDYARLVEATGMLSPHQQHLVSSFLIARESPSQDMTLLPAKDEHESVEAEVAMERAQYTETGQSYREKELLTNIGRLEDQLEGYRRMGPNLRRHMEMQAATTKTLQELQAKTHSIEELAATLWWDSKMIMCITVVFSFALCFYVSILHARQSTSQSSGGFAVLKPKGHAGFFHDAAPEDSDVRCEYFDLGQDGELSQMTEEQWWAQPCVSKQKAQHPAPPHGPVLEEPVHEAVPASSTSGEQMRIKMEERRAMVDEAPSDKSS
jgi:hypothetical protein